MSHSIDLDVAFYMHLTWQFDSAHVKRDVSFKPGLSKLIQTTNVVMELGTVIVKILEVAS